MDLVVIGRGARQRRLVLRRWVDDEPGTDGLVVQEAQALQALEDSDVTAPRLIATDPTGDAAGVPCLAMTEVRGQVVLTPTHLGRWLDELATTQARIHRLPATLPASLWPAPGPCPKVEWIADPGLRREVAAATGEPASPAAVLVHGDYQPFNVLWNAEQLSGVVDWTMAGTGSRGVDVGHCRLNLPVSFSAEVAESYQSRYERAAGVTVDPRADLRALQRWDASWLDFIPRQVAGRTRVDLAGMAGRVVQTIRSAVDRISRE